MEVTVMVKGKEVTIYRERPATKAERKRDPDTSLVTEWVRVKYSLRKPVVVTSRDFCSND